MHLYDVRQGDLDVQYVVQEATKALAPSCAHELAEAVRWLHDPTLHELSIARVMELYAVPSDAVPRVKQSRFSLQQVQQMEEFGIVHLDVPDDAQRQTSVFGFTVAEPSKVPPRLRIIFDTLLANTFADDALPVEFRGARDLLTFFRRHQWFVSFDFKAWYFQFALSEEVAALYVGRIPGDHTFRIRRPAMGHKRSVKVAHCVSNALARIAIIRAQASHCECDVIIDNVCFGGPLEELRRVEVEFRHICEEAHAVIGDSTPISKVITHRGLVYDAAYSSLSIKASWCTKTLERIAQLIEKPNYDKVISLMGSFNYVRIYFGARCPPWHFLAKGAARWAQSPRTKYSMSPSILHQLQQMAEFLRAAPARVLSIPEAAPEDEILVTDAHKAGPFAAWGAVLIKGDQVHVRSGKFQFNCPEKIAQLELRAVGCALRAFANRLAAPVERNLNMMTDNTAVLYTLQKGTSPTPCMMTELIPVLHECATLQRTLFVKFVPSEWNVADKPSRGILFIDDEKVQYARNSFASRG